MSLWDWWTGCTAGRDCAGSLPTTPYIYITVPAPSSVITNMAQEHFPRSFFYCSLCLMLSVLYILTDPITWFLSPTPNPAPKDLYKCFYWKYSSLPSQSLVSQCIVQASLVSQQFTFILPCLPKLICSSPRCPILSGPDPLTSVCSFQGWLISLPSSGCSGPLGNIIWVAL